MWVHYFDPHANYVAHPEAPDFRPGAKNWAKPLYDGEVWFTDHHIGRLLDFIASQPWGKKTAIVVTADHGEAFEEHGMSYHGVDLWEPLVRVPLVVYVPGREAAPREAEAEPHRPRADRARPDGRRRSRPEGELSGESNAAAIVSPDEVTIDERDVFMDMPAGPQVSQHRAIIHGRDAGDEAPGRGRAGEPAVRSVARRGASSTICRDATGPSSSGCSTSSTRSTGA